MRTPGNITPSKKTMILAGAFSAGLLAVGGTLAVADGAGSGDAGTVTAAAEGTVQAPSSTTTSQDLPATAVSRDQAREIALGIVPGARVVDIELSGAEVNDDVSDRVTRWEVDLVRGNVEYDVDIDAQDGDVLKNRSEVDDDATRDDRRDDSSDDDRRGGDDDRHYDDHGGDHGDDDHGDDRDGDD